MTVSHGHASTGFAPSRRSTVTVVAGLSSSEGVTGMKRTVAIVAALVLLGSPAVASGAEAATGWADVVWRDMRMLAPEGAASLGRSTTVNQVQRSCRYLDSGVPAATLVSNALAVATQSATSRQQRSDMAAYGLSVLLVAGKRLCPRHLAAVTKAMSLTR